MAATLIFRCIPKFDDVFDFGGRLPGELALVQRVTTYSAI